MSGILLSRPLATTQMDIFGLFGVTAWDYTVSCAAFHILLVGDKARWLRKPLPQEFRLPNLNPSVNLGNMFIFIADHSLTYLQPSSQQISARAYCIGSFKHGLGWTKTKRNAESSHNQNTIAQLRREEFI